jgi:hypothetical protein
MARPGTAVERRADDRAARALADRVVDALERQLARAVERRLGGESNRRPGRFEQRVVALLQRRMSVRTPAPAGTGALGRAAHALGRRRPGGGLPAERATTLRTLVVAVLARTIVRALARLLRVLSRGLVSGPVRRLARLLARRTLRAGPTNQVGILALLLAAVLLAYRALVRRLAGMPEARQAAIRLGLRGLRAGLPALLRLARRLLRRLTAIARRELARVAAARRRRP